MSSAHLEHINVTVKNPDAVAAVLADLFGWSTRWSGTAIHGGRAVHVGSDSTYVALYTLPPLRPRPDDSYRSHLGVNHLGIVVDDLDSAEARARKAGLEPYSHSDYAPGRRFYLRLQEGLEIEVLSYAERKPS